MPVHLRARRTSSSGLEREQLATRSRLKAEVREARATKIRPARDQDVCRQLASGFTR